MYCTQCNTAFSWRTGEIETGTIHNPHYYDYLRTINGGEAPRNAGDVPCGGLAGAYTVEMFLRRGHYDMNTIGTPLLSFHQKLAHIINEIQQLPNTLFHPNTNTDLRVKYLAGEIDEAAMKKALQMREKKLQKQYALRQLYEMLTATGADIFRSLLARSQTAGEAVKELRQLFNYANECITTINSQYGSKIPLI